MTKYEIVNYLKEHKNEFKEKYGVEKIGLFGSFARDEASSDSDIDIFVDMKVKFDNVMGLKYNIEESLNKKVDLVTKHKNIKPILLDMINKDIIYA
ncbi:MAG: nucleotidyltransferase family protein [Arcobacteraceae bacterium]